MHETQAEEREAPVPVEYPPTGQDTHVVLARADAYWPAEQDKHRDDREAPAPVWYFPAAHELHREDSEAPVPVPYVPAGQFVHPAA